MATHGIRYGEGLQIALLEPITTIADGESEWVELENMHWLTFFVFVGTITSSTDSINVYVRSTTSATSGTTNSNDYALPFDYRLSSALGTDTWGAITSVTTATVEPELSQREYLLSSSTMHTVPNVWLPGSKMWPLKPEEQLANACWLYLICP